MLPNPYESPVQNVEGRPRNTEVFGLISFVVGLISLAALPLSCCCGVGNIIFLPIPITGIVLGIVSISKCRAEPERYPSARFGVVGIILSAVAVIVTLAVFTLLIFMFNSDLSGESLIETLEKLEM
jgi:hypothetical protein